MIKNLCHSQISSFNRFYKEKRHLPYLQVIIFEQIKSKETFAIIIKTLHFGSKYKYKIDQE